MFQGRLTKLDFWDFYKFISQNINAPFSICSLTTCQSAGNEQLPLLQNGPVHPDTHPIGQWPVMGLQVVFLQFILHGFLQLSPYQPDSHSVGEKCVSILIGRRCEVKNIICQLIKRKYRIYLLNNTIHTNQAYRINTFHFVRCMYYPYRFWGMEYYIHFHIPHLFCTLQTKNYICIILGYWLGSSSDRFVCPH